MKIKKRGFTLIEILVTCAIIAVLSTVVVANYANAKKKTRDSKRISDIVMMTKLLDTYREQTNIYPPNTCSTGGATPTSLTAICRFDGNCVDGTCTSMNVLVSGGYVTTLPHDPLMGKTTSSDYWYYDYSGSTWLTSLPLGVYLGARLETTVPNGVVVPYKSTGATASSLCGKDDDHTPTDYCAMLPAL